MNNFRPKHAFVSKQTQDESIGFAEFPRGYIRYLYARSADSRTSGSEGQDYLALGYTENALGFVICDGVGGSFCGNIAAKYLGELLLDELLFDIGPTLDASENVSILKERAMKYLNRWREGGHKLVESVELPERLPPLQLKALQELKREQGSETMFVCGRLSFDQEKLILIWMGNTEARVFDRQGQRVEIEGQWRNSDRWSTRHGVSKRGVQVHAWMGDIEEYQIDRIIAFSDGFSAVADKLHRLQDDELQAMVGEQLMAPSSDDISFFDVRLKPPGVIQAFQELRQTGNKIVWPVVKGAERYELEEAANGVFYGSKSYRTKKAEWPLDHGELKSETAYRYYRGRAQAGGHSSGWSQALRLPPLPLSVPEPVRIQDSPDDPGTYTISWSAVKGAQYYVLIEQADPKREREVYLGPGLKYTVTRQQPGTYRYRAQACGPAGQSNPSAICKKEVPPISTAPRPDKAKDIAAQHEVRVIPQQEEISSPAAEERQKVASMPTYSGPDRLKEAAQAQPEIKIEPHQEISPPAIELERPKLHKMRAVKVNQPYTVSWSAVRGADCYELQVADSKILAESGHFFTVHEGPDSFFKEKGKEKGTYYYRVRALANGQRSKWSAQEYISVQHSLKPDVPQMKAIDNPSGSGSYVVEWSPVPEAEWYELQEAKQVNSKSDLFYYHLEVEVEGVRKTSRRITTDSVTIPEQSPGVYYYRVRACNKHSKSDYSGHTTVKVREPVPEAPKLLSIDNPNGKGYYYVEWTKVKNVADYELYESRAPDFAKQERVYRGWRQYCRITDREPGDYYYRVFSYNRDDVRSQQASNWKHTKVVLETPKLSMGWDRRQRALGTILVKPNWWSVKWAEKYELLCADTFGNEKEYTIRQSRFRRFEAKIPLTEGTYHFRVRAVSRRGIESGWSNTLRVTVRRDNRTNQLRVDS